MKAVLGIDAAWTPTQPSGLALAVMRDGLWKLVTVAPSYEHFVALGAGEPMSQTRPRGSFVEARTLLASASVLCGELVDLVAIDMPLAKASITGRRAADNAVSKAYGARKCSTHTPSAVRPGPISDSFRAEFETAGYPLLTDEITAPGLIEVYPHPALVHLASAAERLPYKASKTRTYWPTSSPNQRRVSLFGEWAKIVELLDARISGVADALPPLASTARGSEIKAYEDMLDAVVCAWVAICALEGGATPFGDENAAIWIPS